MPPESQAPNTAITLEEPAIAGADAYPELILPSGTIAPEFSLQFAADKFISLSDFRGQPVVLAFYPADFSPVCSDQLTLYNEILDEFVRHNARLLGISVDGPFCHQAYAKSRGLEFPLLADFEPKGHVARRYGVYHTQWGVAQRALFVIDPLGMIRWSHLASMDVSPGADGILAALAAI